MLVLLIHYNILFSVCRHKYAANASSRVSCVRACVRACVCCYYWIVPAEYMFRATVPKDSGCSCIPREREFFLQSGSHRKYQFVNTKKKKTSYVSACFSSISLISCMTYVGEAEVETYQMRYPCLPDRRCVSNASDVARDCSFQFEGSVPTVN